MTKETKKIIDFISGNDNYINELEGIRSNYTNSKEFYNQIGYFVMKLVNTEKPLINVRRKNIEFNEICKEFFI